jgi:hypothetical protein
MICDPCSKQQLSEGINALKTVQCALMSDGVVGKLVCLPPDKRH